ncbi:preprotein translocase subunit YajC [Parasphingorhabdus pacifica]
MESLFFPLLIALIAVPMFLQARKQKKTMQEQQKMQNSLVVGDRVMTTSGLYGTVVGTTEESIDLEIASDIVTTWVRAAVREKVNPDAADTEENEDDSDETAEAVETRDADKTDESVTENAEAEKQKAN